MNVNFEPWTRQVAGIEEPYFHARFLQNRLYQEGWVPYQALHFSFREAAFRELPPA